MKNVFLMKILKILLAISITVFAFPVRIFLILFFDKEFDKQVQKDKEIDDDHDEYIESITRRKFIH